MNLPGVCDTNVNPEDRPIPRRRRRRRRADVRVVSNVNAGAPMYSLNVVTSSGV